MAAVDADPRVALLLGEVEVAFHARHVLELAGDIGRLGLDFLHANTIRRVSLDPLDHAFGGGGTDAVEVEAGEFEQGFPHGG